MPTIGPKPYWRTADKQTVKLYHGDVMDVLRKLPAQSVHCCVTSPPYWGLRDYGTGTWVGGDGSCDHSAPAEPKPYLGSDGKLGRDNTNWDNRHAPKRVCGRCGAKRVDRQIGSEAIVDCEIGGKRQRAREGLCPDWETACFVCRMVYVFREVRRVLHDSGTVWLNLGDSYANSGVCGGSSPVGNRKYRETDKTRQAGMDRKNIGLRSGNLVGVPWRAALALQADGWILRSDIPWLKRSAMPESVRNRPAKALEYVFLLAKKPGYYYNYEAVKVRSSGDNWNKHGFRSEAVSGDWVNNNSYVNDGKGRQGTGKGETTGDSGKRSFRNADLWFESVDTPHGLTGTGEELVGLDVTSESYPGAHFATFGKKLLTPLILAGSSAHGCCAKCGAPWRRVVETTQLKRERPNEYVKRDPRPKPHEKSQNTPGKLPYSDKNTLRINTCANTVAGVDSRTVRWEPTCECGADVKPCTILDPFVGSATTCCVALAYGRRSIGIDLSEKYLRENAVPRIEGELLARPALAHLAGRKRKAVMVGEPISEGNNDVP